jgi:hypothetical protein
MDNIKEREYLLYRFNHALKEEKRYIVNSSYWKDLEQRSIDHQKLKTKKNDN